MSQFEFVGRYSIYDLDLTVVDSQGNVVDADALPEASFRTFSDDAEVWSRTTTHISNGKYRLTLSSAETADAGLYSVLWSYDLSAVAQLYRTDIEVPSTTSSLYESLSADYREIIEGVWNRFEDLFDSDIGGPHLKMYAQTNFGRERVAQLLKIALGRINTAAQPHATYSFDRPFPFSEWGAILEQATAIEVIKHLIRSYVEQPQAESIPSARLDRRDYMARWSSYLTAEEDVFNKMLQVFKMAQMNLGAGAVLVGGGIYGEWARNTPPTRPRAMPPIVRW